MSTEEEQKTLNETHSCATSLPLLLLSATMTLPQTNVEPFLKPNLDTSTK